MTAPTGPTFFADVDTVSFVANSVTTNIFAVKRISISRNETMLRGRDNNRLRSVGAHLVGVDDQVTIETEDGNVAVVLMGLAGYPGVLTFNWRPYAHNFIGANQLAEQLITVSGLVIDKKSLGQPMQANGTFSISGFLVESSSGDTTDPIAFTVASTPPVNTEN
jgi:hypothetical protein